MPNESHFTNFTPVTITGNDDPIKLIFALLDPIN
jgi:hypothetical protein